MLQPYVSMWAIQALSRLLATAGVLLGLNVIIRPAWTDGGIYSTSNLDLVRGQGLDLVICLNPTSSLADPGPSGPAHMLAATWRRLSGRRLGWEAKRLRAAGTDPQEHLKAGGRTLYAHRFSFVLAGGELAPGMAQTFRANSTTAHWKP